MTKHTLFAGRRIVDKPGFLEFQPGFRVEVVEFVGHIYEFIMASSEHATNFWNSFG